MVLPLPYCQLLKIFEMFFVFTLPFPLVASTGVWTIAIAGMCAVGVFGLDSVAAELECPFGIDDNDFPLLKMYTSLVSDFDAMVSTLHSDKLRARWERHRSGQSGLPDATPAHRAAGKHHLRWDTLRPASGHSGQQAAAACNAGAGTPLPVPEALPDPVPAVKQDRAPPVKLLAGRDDNSLVA